MEFNRIWWWSQCFRRYPTKFFNAWNSGKPEIFIQASARARASCSWYLVPGAGVDRTAIYSLPMRPGYAGVIHTDPTRPDPTIKKGRPEGRPD